MDQQQTNVDKRGAKAVIVFFRRGTGRFRVVCVPGRRPVVEVSTTDTDALGVQVHRWTAASGFPDVMVSELLRDAMLKTYAELLETSISIDIGDWSP
jgi:hypothetical protein